MKFALVNGEKLEAKPGSKGICPCCSANVRAYCGLVKVHHWKHISLKECDPWYEGETDWHRNWKNNFDSNCQEVIKVNPISGERHIADLYLEHKDLVIEFQHSPIQIEEIIAREQFYKRMLWIVDLTSVNENIEFYSDFRKAYLEVIEKQWFTRVDLRRREIKKKGNSPIDDKNEMELFESEDEYTSSYVDKYYPRTNNPDYFLMSWKFRHKRWEKTRSPMFFDVGDEYVYQNIESIKIANCNVVKRYLKTKFIDHYMRIPDINEVGKNT